MMIDDDWCSTVSWKNLWSRKYSGRKYPENIQAENIHKKYIQAENIHKKHIQAENIHKKNIQAENIHKKHIQAENIHKKHIQAENIHKKNNGLVFDQFDSIQIYREKTWFKKTFF